MRANISGKGRYPGHAPRRSHLAGPGEKDLAVPVTAVILAGGQGTRLRPLTHKIPKPLVPVANVPLIVWTLEKVRRAGIKKAVILCGSKLLDLGPWKRTLNQAGLEIEFFREPSPLGTGGAFALAAEKYPGLFMCFNGDLLWELDLNHVLERHLQHQAQITVVVRETMDPARYGLLVRDEHERVQAWIEKPSAQEIKLLSPPYRINAGFYVLDSRLFVELGFQGAFSIEKSFFPTAIEKGIPFRLFTMTGYWKDLGTPESYLQANMDFLEGKFRSEPVLAESQGTWFHDQGTNKSDLCVPVLVGPGAEVKDGAAVGPGVVLGPSCKISRGAQVEESVICEKADIGTEAILKGVIVGPGVRIPAHACPRPGSIIV